MARFDVERFDGPMTQGTRQRPLWLLRVRPRHLALAVVAVLVLGGGLYWAVGGGGGGASPAAPGTAAVAPPVEVASVTVASITRSANAVGSLRSNETVVVRPEIAGRIVKINFDEGAQVQKGDVLIALDDSVDRAELGQERARLALAEANYARADSMADRGFGTAKARDEALSAREVARASVQLAESKLSKTVIRAPFGGTVGLRRVSIGDYVNAGQDLVNLESIDPIKVDFRIPEVFLTDLKPGQGIDVTIEALDGLHVAGKVVAIDPLIDRDGRSIVIRAVIPNRDRRLRPGLYAQVELIFERRDNAILVPESALFPVGERRFVYLLVDGKVVRREVKTGLRRDAMVEIVEGLAPEDKVVTAGHMRLQDGVPVTVVSPAS